MPWPLKWRAVLLEIFTRCFLTIFIGIYCRFEMYDQGFGNLLIMCAIGLDILRNLVSPEFTNFPPQVKEPPQDAENPYPNGLSYLLVYPIFAMMLFAVWYYIKIPIHEDTPMPDFVLWLKPFYSNQAFSTTSGINLYHDLIDHGYPKRAEYVLCYFFVFVIHYFFYIVYITIVMPSVVEELILITYFKDKSKKYYSSQIEKSMIISLLAIVFSFILVRFCLSIEWNYQAPRTAVNKFNFPFIWWLCAILPAPVFLFVLHLVSSINRILIHTKYNSLDLADKQRFIIGKPETTQ